MDNWISWANYERYMGRWSRLVATRFLRWLAVLPGRRWLDVGCGTGALTEAILQERQPRAVSGIDPSETFLARAHQRVNDTRASFQVGDAMALPFADAAFDAVVAGLVLNYFIRPDQGIVEMARACRTNGVVGGYVWDYAQGMQMTGVFWDAVAELYGPTELDQGRRFPICHPEPLAKLFEDTGLTEVEVTALEITLRFGDFDDFWQPFLGGQGPAPTYLATLTEDKKMALGEHIRSRLPSAPDGSLALSARAWAVRGRK